MMYRHEFLTLMEKKQVFQTSQSATSSSNLVDIHIASGRVIHWSEKECQKKKINSAITAIGIESF